MLLKESKITTHFGMPVVECGWPWLLCYQYKNFVLPVEVKRPRLLYANIKCYQIGIEYKIFRVACRSEEAKVAVCPVN